MSSEGIVLKSENRNQLGKGLNQLRRDGLIPGVIHDHGNPSVHVQAKVDELTRMYQKAGKNHPIELKVDDKKFLALVKDVSYKPPKNKLQHVVFQAIKQNEKVEAEIPVHIVGEIPAEKLGLVVLHQLDAVLVEALPRNLPEELTVDGTKLAEAHDKLTVADITAPEGVTILTELEHAVATVAEPRAHVEAESEEEAVAESAEQPSAEQPTEN